MMLTRSSRCAATVGTSSYHLRHPRLSNSPTFSRRQHSELVNFADIFTSTTQLSRLHRLGLNWTRASTKAGEDLPNPRRADTVLVLSFHVTETVLHMHNYTYATHARPSNIGCNATRHLTRSSRGACKVPSSHTTAGLTFRHALEVFEESECENISIQPEP